MFLFWFRGNRRTYLLTNLHSTDEDDLLYCESVVVLNLGVFSFLYL